MRPGPPYLELHLNAHRKSPTLARDRSCATAAQRAVERGLTRPFFPHGVGHLLGIQTTTSAGIRRSPAAAPPRRPRAHPFLRTTRTIEPGQVFTIEPGVYFIDMLLRAAPRRARRGRFDWELIDRLTPLGGIRIEDNVVVTAPAPAT